MNNNGKFSTFLALTDIGDDLVSEATEERIGPGRPLRRLIPWAAAVLLAALAAVIILKNADKHGEKSAYGETTAAPTEFGGEIPEPSFTSFQTEINTAGASTGPSSTPSATASAAGSDMPTEIPSPFRTPTPTPVLSSLPSSVPTPSNTETAQPTPFITPYYTPAPSFTPAPPLPSSEPPVPTAAPTEIPEPTEMPPVPDELIFHSEYEFVMAVRNHAHPMLEGLLTYYTPENLFSGMSLVRIAVRADSVDFVYISAEGDHWVFSWYRDRDGSYISVIALQYGGEWHGSHFVLAHGSSDVSMNVYWAQHGLLFKASIPSSTEDRAMFRFCSAGIKTV